MFDLLRRRDVSSMPRTGVEVEWRLVFVGVGGRVPPGSSLADRVSSGEPKHERGERGVVSQPAERQQRWSRLRDLRAAVAVGPVSDASDGKRFEPDHKRSETGEFR